jgi:hypothetical protein
MFGMVEVDFKCQSFLLIKEITNPPIVLGNTERDVENSFIPSGIVVRPNLVQGILVAQRRLIYFNIRPGIPFFIIAPGKIKFPFPFTSGFLGKYR